jgi:hypothetical protein
MDNLIVDAKVAVLRDAPAGSMGVGVPAQLKQGHVPGKVECAL